MLRGTRENRSFRALTLNYAGMAALCFLLLASTIVAVIPQTNLLHSTLAPAAYAQENTEETDTGEAGEAEETDTGEAEEADTGEAEEADTGEAEEADTGEAEETDTGEAEETDTGEEDDTTAPTVTNTEPADNATDVQVTLTSINATFSEDVCGTVDDGNFVVGDADLNPINGTVTCDDLTATFTPSENLAFDSEYTAVLTNEIMDAAGNSLAPTDWSFTTAAEEDEEVPPPGEEVPPPGEEVPPPGGSTDPFGIDELYATASSGPTWYISEEEDPTSDGHFYLSMYSGTTFGYRGSGVWNVDATSGTQEHGIRMHVDSPSGSWTNTEMTGYFKANSGSDQFTMIARHGPSYHDDNGCQAYGYYGMTAIDGNVFFKKKLYHFNDGYTKRLAQVEALDNLSDEWVGMKFVVYDLPNGDVKLELWIDEGDMTDNWNKVTELVDSGNHAVEGGDDCGRDATDTIDSGTRVTYRVDNMEFDFKKLSAREIQPPNGGESAAVAAEPEEEEESAAGTAAAAEPQGDEQTGSSEEPQGDEQTGSSEEQQQESADEVLSNLQGSLGLWGIAFPR
jgi:Bacterial Ig-like domain